MAKTILATAAVSLALTVSATALADGPPAESAPKPAEPAANAPAKNDAAPAKNDATKAAAKDTDPALEAAIAAAAKGDAGPKKNVAQDPIVSTRRAGFTIGISGAAGFGDITGYPLDIAKRDKPQYLANTGASVGANGTAWLGGAITDWLVFGLGLGGTYSQGNGVTVSGYTFVFHTEVFPLFWLGGFFREAGLALDTGAGTVSGELSNKPSGAAGKQIAPVIDSGSASRVGVSLFYDGLRLWKVSTGPFVAFDYTWSATLQQPLFLVGLRTALYVKAPTK